MGNIRKTCPCNVYPLKPNFYIVKLGFAGVYLFFLFLLQTEIKMKRLESPPSGHFMIVARVPVAPPTIRRHTVSKTKPVL